MYYDKKKKGSIIVRRGWCLYFHQPLIKNNSSDIGVLASYGWWKYFARLSTPTVACCFLSNTRQGGEKLSKQGKDSTNNTQSSTLT